MPRPAAAKSLITRARGKPKCCVSVARRGPTEVVKRARPSRPPGRREARSSIAAACGRLRPRQELLDDGFDRGMLAAWYTARSSSTGRRPRSAQRDLVSCRRRRRRGRASHDGARGRELDRFAVGRGQRFGLGENSPARNRFPSESITPASPRLRPTRRPLQPRNVADAIDRVDDCVIHLVVHHVGDEVPRS